MSVSVCVLLEPPESICAQDEEYPLKLSLRRDDLLYPRGDKITGLELSKPHIGRNLEYIISHYYQT